MANKIYVVVKDGEELDKLKTLTAAKKLADEEGADVYSDGKCVYQGAVTAVEDAGTEAVKAEETEAVRAGEKESPVGDEPEKEQPVRETSAKNAALYRLKTLMNVRKKPNGEIVRTLSEGTVVEVSVLESDWLHLTDGTFILYKAGEFAEKI